VSQASVSGQIAFYEEVMAVLSGEGTTTQRVRGALECVARAVGVEMASATLVDQDALARGASMAWMLASVTWASDPMDMARLRAMDTGSGSDEHEAFRQLVDAAPVTVEVLGVTQDPLGVMRRYGVDRALVHCREVSGGDVWLFSLLSAGEGDPFGEEARGMLEYAARACALVLAEAAPTAPEERDAHPVRALTDLPDFVFVVDEEGFYRDVHTTRESGLLLEPSQIIGARIGDVLPEEVARRFEATIAEVTTSGQRARFDYELLQDDVVRSYTASIAPYELDDRKAVLCTCRDMTTFMAAEREQSNERKLASLYSMAGGITHDLNNVLAALMGNLELARLDLGRSHPAYASIDAAERAGARAVSICDKLRTYTGSRALATRRHTLGEVMAAFEERAAGVTRVDVTTTLGEGDAAAGAMVELDLIVGALLDLVDNASDAGAAHVEVTFARSAERGAPHAVQVGHALGDGELLALTVRDEGDGMSKDVVARALDPFFSTRFTGRGLGLSVVLGVARLHGGALALDSAPGKGTTATLYLPAA
jgi:signal transduction histidine kinase